MYRNKHMFVYMFLGMLIHGQGLPMTATKIDSIVFNEYIQPLHLLIIFFYQTDFFLEKQNL